MTDPAGTDVARPSFLDSLGPRGARRAEPRATIALAGAGCALAVVGVLLLAGDAGFGNGSGYNRAPGVVLSALVLFAGLFALRLAPNGPVATAGSVAMALGIPATVVFLIVKGSEGSIQSAMILATGLWALAYAVGPGRGRPVFLGLSLFGAWSSVLQLVGGSLASSLSVAPVSFVAFGSATDSAYSSGYGSSYTSSYPSEQTGGFGSGPDLATVGLVSIAIGVAYLVLSRRFDAAGRRGISTPFAVVGLLALLEGATTMVIELHQVAGGLLLAATGVALAVHGSTRNRRLTTWVGAVTTVVGIGVTLSDLIDSVSTAGLVFAIAGLAVVAGAQVLSLRLSEPDEMQPIHDRPRRRQLVAAPK